MTIHENCCFVFIAIINVTSTTHLCDEKLLIAVHMVRGWQGGGEGGGEGSQEVQSVTSDLPPPTSNDPPPTS